MSEKSQKNLSLSQAEIEDLVESVRVHVALLKEEREKLLSENLEVRAEAVLKRASRLHRLMGKLMSR
jgi:hypothetical protein